MVATLGRRHEFGFEREALVERTPATAGPAAVRVAHVDAAKTGRAGGEPARSVIVELDTLRAAAFHTGKAGAALTEDEYFALPSSYLEYEWQ